MLTRVMMAIALLMGLAACDGGGLGAGDVPATMSLRSSALADGAEIPPAYRCTDDDHLGQSRR